MAFTAHDILMDADLFRAAYPRWPSASRAASDKLAALRSSLIAAGWTAESPAVLDPEAERMAREDRKD